MHYLSFGITKIYYSSGDNPTFVSLSYLIWYIINILIISFVGTFIKKAELFITFLLTIYLVIVVLVLIVHFFKIYNETILEPFFKIDV